jgi:S-adenosyl-L-methionine hydrolase (adenosine-forming)
MGVIALMTDFGTRDHYVAAMKGMILQINPKVTLVDITHDLDPQDILGASFTLRQAFPCFPTETVFVAVVDPTVGTPRRILAGRYSDRFVLAPDNGVLTFLQRDAELQEMRVIENRQYLASSLSVTFHGRDIFAPVAGHLSKGVPLVRVGPPADRIEILDLPRPHRHPSGNIEGAVLYIDRFGNLITNICAMDLSPARARGQQWHVSLDRHDIGTLRTTYADVPPGEPLALIGSTQMLEIAVNQGSAARTFQAARGHAVRLSPLSALNASLPGLA